MKLPRTTLVLIFLALGLSGFVYFYEIQGRTQREEIKAQNQRIFSFTENDIESLKVETEDITLNLERNTESDTSRWLLTSPTTEPAHDAIVAYLTNLLANSQSDRTLSIQPDELEEFGFNQPLATININLKNEETHQLILGKPDFNRRFLYARTDISNPENGNINVLLVSTDFQNAVNRDFSEWQKPPQTNKDETIPEDEIIND